MNTALRKCAFKHELSKEEAPKFGMEAKSK